MRVCVFVCVMFFNGLEKDQNYILWWQKWKNEIRAQILGGMILTKKLSPRRQTLLVIILSTTNSGLYKRNSSYSSKFINPNSWIRMWTGRPKDRVSIPG
jgi:hypothetical protein